MQISRALVSALLTEARAAHPRECCGVLFGTEAAITAHQPAANVHHQSTTHFEIDPQTLIDAHRAMRAGGLRLVGYYHSHPNGLPEPSSTDRTMAASDGMIWAIVAQDHVRLWRATALGFIALSYTPV